jgi:hypothetical protein
VQELDLGEKAKLAVKFGGATFEVALPNVKQAMEYKDSLDANKGKETELFLGLLEKLGLPKEVSEQLTLVQMEQLANALMAAKKN